MYKLRASSAALLETPLVFDGAGRPACKGHIIKNTVMEQIVMFDPVFTPENLHYLEELYRSWREAPDSVDKEWQDMFAGARFSDSITARSTQKSLKVQSAAYKQSRVESLIWAYRDVGYLYARLNPLTGYLSADLHYLYRQREGKYERLTPDEFGLSEEDLHTAFSAGRYLKPERAPLVEIIQALTETYCSSIGVEFLHIQDKTIRNWLMKQMESTRNRPLMLDEKRRIMLEDLIKAEEFEHFLHSRFIGQKRFSLEGAEVLIPALHFLVDSCAYRGVEEIFLGMSHRGRLNVLANILDKPLDEIFSSFEAFEIPQAYGGSGDVKYHLGYRRMHLNEDKSSLSISLAPNPSHLESVDAVVEGMARAAQDRLHDTGRKQVVPVLIHGDAAFSGQGVVAEVLNLSQLNGYKTGGTIHIVINNQIGFTTSTKDARSTFFPTDVVKMEPIPIFHVNGDDPEAVIHVINMAFNFRQEFGRDVVVDIFCYRRHGHNEGDEPSFTHPRMYALIKNHQSVRTLYAQQLADRGTFGPEEQRRISDGYKSLLREAMKSRIREVRPGVEIGSDECIQEKCEKPQSVDTAIDRLLLTDIARKATQIPGWFHAHKKLQRIIHEKRKRIDGGGIIDYSLAETIAFGSLLVEGIPIRLSGEDSGRGTFSQRHAVWWDTESDEPLPYVPLNNIADGQAVFSVYDSPLSEYSILGFEYGYSISNPRVLVLWEAQFGDFSNGAQVVIDNYIASGEAKWRNLCPLTLLLPHGYEGQGPEHSSAHLERFLQLCAAHNLQVCNPTTPAQYFHLLRRQAKSGSRPLVIMTPKSLLRHPKAVSSQKELTSGSFMSLIDESELSAAPETIKTVCFCTGKIYYTLTEKRALMGVKDTAAVRIEQLYPFPAREIDGVFKRYLGAEKYLWVQEEPRNRGAWGFIKDRFDRDLDFRNLQYIGREESASPATGFHARHQQEREDILNRVFGGAVVKKNVRRDVRKKQASV